MSKEQFGRIDQRFNELRPAIRPGRQRHRSTSDSTGSTSDSANIDQRIDQRFGQVDERLDRLETGQVKMSDRIETLDQHMHVLTRT